MNTLLNILGVTNASGRWYLFWSGVFGDVTIFGTGLAIVKHRQCHVAWCWRLAKHDHPAGYKVCTKHHPVLPNKITPAYSRNR